MKNIKKFAALFLAVCTLITFVACNGGTTETPTDPVTQPETEAEVTVSPETDASETNPATEAPTEEPTEAPTEAPTEPPFEAPEEAPDTNSLLTFFDTPENAELMSGKQYGSEIVTDEDGAPVLKLFTEGKGNFRDPYIEVEYADYMKLLGMEPIAWNDCGYAVVTLKVESATNTKFEMVLTGTNGSDDAKIKGESYYAKLDGWQTIKVPLVTLQRDDFTLESIRIDFVDRAEAAGETVYIRSVAFTSDKVEMMELMGQELISPQYTTVTIPGLTNEYKFLQVTDLHTSAFSEEETKTMDQNRVNLITSRRNAFGDGYLLSEERMPYMFGYADEIEADLLLLTGDILDFPSQKNLQLLRENIAAIQTRSFFILGNHDWCYGDSDYFSQYAIENQIPLFKDISVGEPANDPYFHYVEYEDLLVVAVDNSMDAVTEETLNKFLALYEKNKPIILMLHVPLHVDTLVEDSTKVWGRDLAMGGDTGVGAWRSEVQRFYQAVAEDEDSPVVAVFAGHVHFNHEDILPNGVPQYITSTAYTGDCRVITVKGEEAGA